MHTRKKQVTSPEMARQVREALRLLADAMKAPSLAKMEVRTEKDLGVASEADRVGVEIGGLVWFEWEKGAGFAAYPMTGWEEYGTPSEEPDTDSPIFQKQGDFGASCLKAVAAAVRMNVDLHLDGLLSVYFEERAGV